MGNRFRWVECQLTTLRGKRSLKAVKEALRQLPKGLEATYDRILNNIPEDERQVAHCVLQLLTVSYRPLTIGEIAEAIVVDCKKQEVDPDLALRDPHEILEICPSLIELSRCLLIQYESDVV
jgi:hypothetical protein